MKKKTTINPLKYFNDALAKRKVSLQKAQYGKPTAFQSFVKQYPNSGSDTLSNNAPIFDGNQHARDLAEAQKKTFGDTFVQSANPKDHTTAKGYVDEEGLAEAVAAQKAARIPQQKPGGVVKPVAKVPVIVKEPFKNKPYPGRNGKNPKTGKEEQVYFSRTGAKTYSPTSKKGGATAADRITGAKKNVSKKNKK